MTLELPVVRYCVEHPQVNMIFFSDLKAYASHILY